jgi:hypothetical protein
MLQAFVEYIKLTPRIDPKHEFKSKNRRMI